MCKRYREFKVDCAERCLKFYNRSHPEDKKRYRNLRNKINRDIGNMRKDRILPWFEYEEQKQIVDYIMYIGIKYGAEE